MTHYSQVSDVAFAKIVAGERQIEPRLHDPSHKAIKAGDLILFQARGSHAEVLTKVVGLLRFGSFVELFHAYPPERFGANNEQELLSEMRRTYTPDQEAEHGVLGVKLHLLK